MVGIVGREAFERADSWPALTSGEPLFDTIDTVKGSLKIFAEMIALMKVRAENMRIAAARGFSTATDVADYCVRKGLPFRSAHEVVGKTVRYCIDNDKDIPDLSIGEFRQFSELIDEDIYDYVTLEASVNARRATGGTAREAVEREIARALKACRGNKSAAARMLQISYPNMLKKVKLYALDG